MSQNKALNFMQWGERVRHDRQNNLMYAISTHLLKFGPGEAYSLSADTADTLYREIDILVCLGFLMDEHGINTVVIGSDWINTRSYLRTMKRELPLNAIFKPQIQLIRDLAIIDSYIQLGMVAMPDFYQKAVGSDFTEAYQLNLKKRVEGGEKFQYFDMSDYFGDAAGGMMAELFRDVIFMPGKKHDEIPYLLFIDSSNKIKIEDYSRMSGNNTTLNSVEAFLNAEYNKISMPELTDFSNISLTQGMIMIADAHQPVSM